MARAKKCGIGDNGPGLSFAIADRKDGQISDRWQEVRAASTILRDARASLKYRMVEFQPQKVCRTAMIEMVFLAALPSERPISSPTASEISSLKSWGYAFDGSSAYSQP